VAGGVMGPLDLVRSPAATDPVSVAVERLAAGRMVLLRDDRERQGEGDLLVAAEFAGRGPRDPQGRSLRALDLKTRLFRYPCSYLIYSRAFDSLPDEVKEHVYRRLWEILNDRGTGRDDPHLAAADCEAIVGILRATKPDLPDYWQAPAPR